MRTFHRLRFLVPVFAIGALVLPNVGCSDETGPASAKASELSSRSLASPTAPSQNADDAVMTVARAVADGDLHVAWDALPGSYQRDVTRLVHEFGSQMDPDVWNKSFELVRKIGVLLDSKKDLILAMPKLQESPDFDVFEASQQWDHVVSIFTTIANSPISNVDSLQRMDVRKVLGTTGSAVMSDIIALGNVTDNATDKLDDFRALTATVERSDGDFAVVVIEIPGQSPMTEEFARVEGKWIPKEMADEWQEGIAEAFTSLEDLGGDEFAKSKPQIMAALTAVEGVIDQLHAAQTPEEFEQGLQMGMMQVFGAIMTMSRTMQ